VSDAPSSEIPPRSGAGRPLARGPISIKSRVPPRVSLRLARGYHGPATSIPAPPAGAFNALTFAGAQAKGESTPLRAWELCPGTAPPTPVARPSPPLCSGVRHGQQQPNGTMPPMRAAHSKKDGRALEGKTNNYTMSVQGQRRDIGPAGPVTSVAIGPVRPSPPSPTPSRPLHHPPGHCITLPDAVEACGDGTPPHQLLYPHMALRQQHPRVLTRAVAGQETSTPPPSKPLLDAHRTHHDTPPEARFARMAIYSVTLYTMPLHIGEIVWYACKLPPLWPIKGGAVP
jgi:hypothetical protein